jgi:hypothetical protein
MKKRSGVLSPFHSLSSARYIKLPKPPKSLTLKMATAMFAEMLESLQYTT